MSSQKEKKSQSMLVFRCQCSAGASYTVFVWLVFSLCILYLLGLFSEVNIGYQSPPPQDPHYPPTFIVFVLFLPPIVLYIVPWLFIIFYVIVLFFYTHILINMYICRVIIFFLNCLILLMFPIFYHYYLGWKWEYSWVVKLTFFSYQKGREACCVSTVDPSLALCRFVH